ncbi:hypothetical protein [Parerythrobacter aestuarii]|uniref:hypothetical protein n=1 Tax=Parerythrobacter aestuarii TaxID=3020909 RepID=UPI0024DE0C8F|nr:hypothetical protein [Parerythrobacter aestuarii]
MSIQRVGVTTCCAMLLMGQAAPPANGPLDPKPPEPGTAETAFADAEKVYGPPPPEPEVAADCDDPSGDEIVVCAALEEQEQFRVPSSLDEGKEDHLAWTGDPPDVAGPGIFKGKATVSGCIKGVTCPPPPAYIFDITALPEAPPGSDADKIAKGEMPEP